MSKREKFVVCPTCSTEISREAASCPKCGHTFKPAGSFNLNDPVHLLAATGCAVLLLLILGPLVLKFFGIF